MEGNLEDHSAAVAADLTNKLRGTPPQTFEAGRFLVAVGILAAFLGMAIGTDAAGLATSATALYGLATTTLGLIVGLLGGEHQTDS